MKIAVLCSSRMAMPAMQKLVENGKLAAIGVPEHKTEAAEVCNYLSQRYNVPLRMFSKKEFGMQLGEWLNEIKPDVVFVMTFSFRIPEALLSIPKHGFINFHYGLLPEMRGPDPIFESIRQKRATAGTTVHVMDAGFDTGPIIMREEIQLPPHFSYGMLSHHLVIKSVDMCMALVKTLEDTGTVTSIQQDESKAHYYPALQHSAIQMEWEKMDAPELIALVNSCNPVSKNGVPASINSWTIGVCFATMVSLSGDISAYEPGQIIVIDPQNGLLVFTKDKIALKLEIVYTEEGYFPGHLLAAFGIAAGMKFSGVVSI